MYEGIYAKHESTVSVRGSVLFESLQSMVQDASLEEETVPARRRGSDGNLRSMTPIWRMSRTTMEAMRTMPTRRPLIMLTRSRYAEYLPPS